MARREDSEKRIGLLKEQLQEIQTTAASSEDAMLLQHAFVVLLNARATHDDALGRLDVARRDLRQAETDYALAHARVVGRIGARLETPPVMAPVAPSPEPARPARGSAQVTRIPKLVFRLLSMMPRPPDTARTQDLIVASWQIERPNEEPVKNLPSSPFAANIRDRIRRAKKSGLIAGLSHGHLQLTDAGISVLEASDRVALTDDKED